MSQGWNDWQWKLWILSTFEDTYECCEAGSTDPRTGWQLHTEAMRARLLLQVVYPLSALLLRAIGLAGYGALAEKLCHSGFPRYV